MKNIKNIILSVIFAVFITACSQDPRTTNAKEYKVIGVQDIISADGVKSNVLLITSIDSITRQQRAHTTIKAGLDYQNKYGVTNILTVNMLPEGVEVSFDNKLIVYATAIYIPKGFSSVDGWRVTTTGITLGRDILNIAKQWDKELPKYVNKITGLVDEQGLLNNLAFKNGTDLDDIESKKSQIDNLWGTMEEYNFRDDLKKDTSSSIDYSNRTTVIKKQTTSKKPEAVKPVEDKTIQIETDLEPEEKQAPIIVDNGVLK